MKNQNDDVEHQSTSFVKVDDSLFLEEDDVEPPMWKKRSIFALGFFLACVTMLPNAMMGAASHIAGTLGLGASLLFAMGGMYGNISGEFKCLLPAMTLQLISLLIFVFGQEDGP